MSELGCLWDDRPCTTPKDMLQGELAGVSTDGNITVMSQMLLEMDRFSGTTAQVLAAKVTLGKRGRGLDHTSSRHPHAGKLRTMYVTGAAGLLMLTGALLPLACVSCFQSMQCHRQASAETEDARAGEAMNRFSQGIG